MAGDKMAGILNIEVALDGALEKVTSLGNHAQYQGQGDSDEGALITRRRSSKCRRS